MRLKTVREMRGMTLGQLSERAGLSKSYLSMIERGLRKPDMETMIRLALALNVDLELGAPKENL